MKLIFSGRSWDDYQHWLASDRDMVDRINLLIKETRRQPFVGLGKPEPLRNEMSGFSSRRIDREHRFIYRVTGKGDQQALEIAGCRFHYGR
ncbi:MAG: Txe/YoeB family addiction module toxin [Rhizobiaceae bacterium]|nr:Txe/YoeB family addiction module toxin [Rhizobiaceae bacterium]